jgi:hypothetical protein
MQHASVSQRFNLSPLDAVRAWWRDEGGTAPLRFTLNGAIRTPGRYPPALLAPDSKETRPGKTWSG